MTVIQRASETVDGDPPISAGHAATTTHNGLTRDFGRRLAGWGGARAALILTLVVVLVAELLTLALSHLLYGRQTEETLLLVGLVSATVACPFVIAAHHLIRRLYRSKQSLRKITLTLAAARDEAEAASRAKSEFLAHMSHELRTPLNAIIGFSEVIRDDRLAGDVARYRGYAADINASGELLLQIINDMLDYAKMEAGKMRVDAQEIDLAEIVPATAQLLDLKAQERRVALSVRVAPDLPRVLASPRMMRQMLLNLVSNAIKFTEEDGRVDVDVNHAGDGGIAIRVRDTGIGMSPDEIGVALTPFGQVENVLVRSHGGTGLGLPLAKSMMELHGGRLEVTSAPGAGTTVRLVFPPERVRQGSG